jgi:2'-5' RNA ligase
MFRLFVGIPLPEDVRDTLVRLCGGLPGAKWVDRDEMHITVRFIGEVDGGTARDIDDALCRISAPAFALTLAGIDVFAQSGKVRTLWAGVRKEPLLMHLREKVESAMVRTGLPPERRKYKPHITLARFRNGVSDRMGGYLQRYSQFVSMPFQVSDFTLYRSHLGSRGAHYEAVAEYDLKRGAVTAPAHVTTPPLSTRI